jgi:peroxiredoxin
VDIVLLLARLILLGVFGLAGITKLADLAGSREAMRGFGVPARFVAPAAVALPIAELAIAALLVPVATAWWAALAGLGLLVAFIVGIVVNLRRGRRPDCHCFGQVYSAPIGRTTLIRNSLFAVPALLLVARGPDSQGTSLGGWIGDLSATQRAVLGLELALLGAVGILAWFAWQVLRQQGRVLLRLGALESVPAPVAFPPLPQIGLPIGTQAPPFELAAVDGGRVSLDDLRSAHRPTLLIFTEADCQPCQALLPEIARWQKAFGSVVTIAVIDQGPMETSATRAREHGLTPMLVQQDQEVAEAYASLPTPSAVLIRTDGTIGSQGAVGPDAVRTLAARLVSATMPASPVMPALDGMSPVPPPAPSRVGQPAPEFELPDLAGEPVRLEDFRGREVLLLFWSLDCGFCQQMLGDVKAWEASLSPGAPRLLVISRGDVDANRAMGLQSPVLLDQSLATGGAFGTRGTPAAVLVDAEGRIASDVASGMTAVLGMLRGEPVGSRPR